MCAPYSCYSVKQVVELVQGGAKVRVRNSTKHQYLDALAQYRLANNLKDEVEHFLKGLNELIPDNLLSIFDENELEVRQNEHRHSSVMTCIQQEILCGWISQVRFSNKNFAFLFSFLYSYYVFIPFHLS